VSEPDELDEGPPPRYGVAVVALVAAVTLVLGALAGFALSRPTTPTDGSVDAGFLRDMSSHHAQGVDMAMTIHGSTDDPTLRQVSVDIGLTQQGQIGMMQGWLQQWGLPVVSSRARMSWMAGHDHAAGGAEARMALQPNGLMPGMATQEEIQRLRTLRGTAQEILFLQLMIRHHRAGVDMAAYAAEHAQEPDVRDLAQKMADGQTYEITLLTDMLTDRGAVPLPN
jgi:uncharacterized protein (DUF305 family)